MHWVLLFAHTCVHDTGGSDGGDSTKVAVMGVDEMGTTSHWVVPQQQTKDDGDDDGDHDDGAYDACHGDGDGVVGDGYGD